MALYFETEGQGAAFLCLCALGFVLAAAFDVRRLVLRKHLKPLGDVAAFLLAAALFVFALFVLREDEIRLYHWLALTTGAVLYLCGLRSALRRMLLRARHTHRPPAGEKNFPFHEESAGKTGHVSNSKVSHYNESEG